MIHFHTDLLWWLSVDSERRLRLKRNSYKKELRTTSSCIFGRTGLTGVGSGLILVCVCTIIVQDTCVSNALRCLSTGGGTSFVLKSLF